MIKLYFKDGKMKYEIYDFEDGGLLVTDGEPTYKGLGSGTAKKYYEATKQSINDYVLAIKENLTKYFITQTNVKNKDW